MIQEILLKGVRDSPTPTVTTSTPTLTSNIANNNNNNNNSEMSSRQKLKCPRCDSTNTKFCYYNNYNLTQPRHFCKSCRRYWTKGGTLRNVPIGGGCRKNKSSNATAKAKAALSTEMLITGSPGFLGHGCLDQLPLHSELQPAGPSQNLGASLPQGQGSPIWALLRGAHLFPSPTPTPISSNSFTGLDLDLYGNGAPNLLGSFPRSKVLNGSWLGDPDNTSEIYQKLKSSGNYNSYCGNYYNENDQGGVILGNVVTSSSLLSSSAVNSTVLEATPVGGIGGSLVSYGIRNSGISGLFEFPMVPN